MSYAGLPLADVKENKVSLWVAKDTGIVGVIGMEQLGQDILLRSLVVHPDFRNRKIGANLVDFAIGQAKQRRAQRLFLLTNTAEKYFKQMGFRVITRSDIPSKLLENSGLCCACPQSSSAMTLSI